MQWANQALGYKLIEALKAMAQRNGWDQDLAGVAKNPTVVVLKRRLVDAILGKLRDAGVAPIDWSAERAAFEFGGVEVASVRLATIQELDPVAQVLGRALREARA